MTKYFTNFEDSHIGDTPPVGWTRRGTVDAALYSMTVGYGTPVFKRRHGHLNIVGAQGQSGFSYDAPGNVVDFDCVVGLKFGTLTYTIVHARAQGTSSVTDGYQFETTLGSKWVKVWKVVGSVRTAIGTVLDLVSFGMLAGDSLLLRFRVNGTAPAVITARAWVAGTPEPTTWGLTITDSSSPITAAGWCGVGGTNLATPTPAYTDVNFFSVGTFGDSAQAPLVNADFTAWLDAVNERRVIAELSHLGFDPTTSPYTSTVTKYIANGGYTSKPWDSPANQHYDGWISRIPTFRQEMGIALSGEAGAGFGNLIVSNPKAAATGAGARDDWLRMKWKREHARLWIGDPTWPKHDFRPWLLGYLGQPSAQDPGQISFPISDLSTLLNDPLQRNLIATGGSANKYKPIALGRPGWVEAVQIGPLEYQVHDGSISPTTSTGFVVYDDFVSLRYNDDAPDTVSAVNLGTETITATNPHGGVVDTRVRFLAGTPPAPLALDTDYWMIAAGLTATDFRLAATQGGSAINLTAGTAGSAFLTYGWTENVGAGTFTLATSAVGRVVVEQVGQDDGEDIATGLDYRWQLPNMIEWVIFDKLGLSRDFMDTTSFEALVVSMISQIFGLWVDTDRHTTREVVGRLYKGSNTWGGWTNDGRLQVGRFDLPAATAVLTLYERDVKAGSLKLVNKLLPIDFRERTSGESARVTYAPKHYTAGAPQVSDPTGIGFQDLKTYLPLMSASSPSYPVDQAQQGDVRPVEPFDLLEVNAPTTEQARLATMFDKQLGVFEFYTRLKAIEVNIGATISLTHSRLGWKQWTPADPVSPDDPTATIDSRLAVVIAKDANLDADDAFKVKLTVFRQIPQFAPGDALLNSLLLEDGTDILLEDSTPILMEA